MNHGVFKSTSRKDSPSYRLEVPADTYLFREGDLGMEMYVIQEGQVEILQGTDGGEKILALLERGDFFGEMSLLEGLPRTASARTKSDTKLLRINGSTFEKLLQDNPEVAVRMMRKLSGRLRDVNRQLQEMLEGTAADPRPTSDTPGSSTGSVMVPERLVHEKSGTEFRLSASSETTVGRRDPVTGIYPDIDLSSVDTERSVSRRHCKIYRRAEKFFLTEEIGTMNGTFARQVRLDTGVPAEIHAGDEVRIGLVTLRFLSE